MKAHKVSTTDVVKDVEDLKKEVAIGVPVTVETLDALIDKIKDL